MWFGRKKQENQDIDRAEALLAETNRPEPQFYVGDWKLRQIGKQVCIQDGDGRGISATVEELIDGLAALRKGQPREPEAPSTQIQDCVGKLVDKLSDPKFAAEEEKRRRVYYQDVVYAVCNWLDKLIPGNKVICGTLECPSTEVQDSMRELVDRVIAADAKGIDPTSPTFSFELAKRVVRDLNTLETIHPENERFKLAAINLRAWIACFQMENIQPLVLNAKRLYVDVANPEELGLGQQ